MIAGMVGIAIVSTILLIWLCYLCCLCCNCSQLKRGIILIKFAAQFIINKPTVFIAPMLVGILVIGFTAFYIAVMIAIQLLPVSNNNVVSSNMANNNAQSGMNSILAAIWSFLYTFFILLFNYMTVFLIATAAGLWYYSVDRNYLAFGFKNICTSHIGSLTFAALIISIVQTVR